MQIDPTLAVVAVVLTPILLGLVGWFARSRVERVEKDLADEKASRAKEIEKLEDDFNQAMANERKGREEDRHAARGMVNEVATRLAAFELLVARECINSERLSVALEPLVSRVGEFRNDIKELFSRVDRKQDKPVGAD